MRRALTIVLLLCLIAGCAGRSDSQPAQTPAALASPAATPIPTPAEAPLPAESNPPGDIPDSQTFVVYSSVAGRYTVDVPEGWARTVSGPDAAFVDKFDGMSVTVAPAVAETRAAIATLERRARAGRDFKIVPQRLPGGAAVVVIFTSNSLADPVTGKRVRLDDRAIVFVRGPQTATVLLWAPLGADNVDQWNRIGSSFRWR